MRTNEIIAHLNKLELQKVELIDIIETMRSYLINAKNDGIAAYENCAVPLSNYLNHAISTLTQN